MIPNCVIIFSLSNEFHFHDETISKQSHTHAIFLLPMIDSLSNESNFFENLNHCELGRPDFLITFHGVSARICWTIIISEQRTGIYFVRGRAIHRPSKVIEFWTIQTQKHHFSQWIDCIFQQSWLWSKNTHFVRESITAWLTSCLTGLDSAALLMLN